MFIFRNTASYFMIVLYHDKLSSLSSFTLTKYRLSLFQDNTVTIDVLIH